MLYSTKQPVPVTVAEPDATYYVAPPNGYGQAAFRRAMTAAGARIFDDATMAAALRTALARLLSAPDDAAALAARLDALDRFAELAAARRDDMAAARQAGEAAPAPSADWLAAAEAADATERLATAGDETYAQMVADRAFYHEIAPLTAFRLFCTGWQGDGLPEVRKGGDGALTQAAMDALPPAHVLRVGWEAVGLMTLPWGAEKN